MERKTIGSFIATLRKANGMTQKELAEKLCVTDKTVSRWETDEGLPDVTVIPVLAEIFGITCDELLRGERNNTFTTTQNPEEISRKGEKQLRHMTGKSLDSLRILSIIAIATAVLGIVASMIANLGFLRAHVGFYLDMAFTIIAIVIEAIAICRAKSSVDEDILEENAYLEFRTKVMNLGYWSMVAIITLFSSTLCLLMVNDTHMGLMMDSALAYGSLAAGITLLLSLIVGFIARNSLYKAGRYYIEDRKKARFENIAKLTAKSFMILVTILFLTFIIHMAMTELTGPNGIAEKITFEDYESFKEFMARKDRMSQRYSNRYMRTYYGNGHYVAGDIAPAPAEEFAGVTTYYDEFGNEISFETAHTRTLRDRNDRIVCTYMEFNENVASVMYKPGNGTALPVEVVTYDALYDARRIVELRHAAFIGLYIVEVIAGVIIYITLRKKA